VFNNLQIQSVGFPYQLNFVFLVAFVIWVGNMGGVGFEWGGKCQTKLSCAICTICDFLFIYPQSRLPWYNTNGRGGIF